MRARNIGQKFHCSEAVVATGLEHAIDAVVYVCFFTIYFTRLCTITVTTITLCDSQHDFFDDIKMDVHGVASYVR